MYNKKYISYSENTAQILKS
jgi:hypothetical protein